MLYFKADFKKKKNHVSARSTHKHSTQHGLVATWRNSATVVGIDMMQSVGKKQNAALIKSY